MNNCKTEFLTDEQLSDLLAAIDADYDTQAGTLLKLALGTGMRRGELLKQLWGDVDLENGFIHIGQPKGGKDQIIPLNQTARELLESHPHTSPYVFPGPDGGQGKSNFRRSIDRIKAAASVASTIIAQAGNKGQFLKTRKENQK